MLNNSSANNPNSTISNPTQNRPFSGRPNTNSFVFSKDSTQFGGGIFGTPQQPATNTTLGMQQQAPNPLSIPISIPRLNSLGNDQKNYSVGFFDPNQPVLTGGLFDIRTNPKCQILFKKEQNVQPVSLGQINQNTGGVFGAATNNANNSFLGNQGNSSQQPGKSLIGNNPNQSFLGNTQTSTNLPFGNTSQQMGFLGANNQQVQSSIGGNNFLGNPAAVNPQNNQASFLEAQNDNILPQIQENENILPISPSATFNNQLGGTSWGVPTAQNSHLAINNNSLVGMVRCKNVKLDSKHYVKCVSALQPNVGLCKQEMRFKFIQERSQQPVLPAQEGTGFNPLESIVIPATPSIGPSQNFGASTSFGNQANNQANLFSKPPLNAPTTGFLGNPPTTGFLGNQQQNNPLLGTPLAQNTNIQPQNNAIFNNSNNFLQANPLNTTQPQNNIFNANSASTNFNAKPGFNTGSFLNQPSNIGGQLNQNSLQAPPSLVNNTSGPTQQKNAPMLAATANTNNTGAMFGAPLNTANTAMPGAPSNTGMLGVPSNTGKPGMFGAPSNTGNTGMFGAPSNAGNTGMFGAPSNAGNTGMFGAPSNAGNTGMFGAPSNTGNTGMFGAPSNAGNTGMFGAPSNFGNMLAQTISQSSFPQMLGNTAFTSSQNPSPISYNNFAPNPLNNPVFSPYNTTSQQVSFTNLSNYQTQELMKSLLLNLITTPNLANLIGNSYKENSLYKNPSHQPQKLSESSFRQGLKPTQLKKETQSHFGEYQKQNPTEDPLDEYQIIHQIDLISEKIQELSLCRELRKHKLETNFFQRRRLQFERSFNNQTPISYAYPHQHRFGKSFDRSQKKKKYRTYNYLPIIQSLEITPSMDELKKMSIDQIQKVQNVKLSNEYGSVEFLQPISLYKADLQNAIHIDQDQIQVVEPNLQYKRVRLTFKDFGGYSSANLPQKKATMEQIDDWIRQMNMQKIRFDIQTGDLVVQFQKEK